MNFHGSTFEWNKDPNNTPPETILVVKVSGEVNDLT